MPAANLPNVKAMLRSWPVRGGSAVVIVLAAFVVLKAYYGVAIATFGVILLCCYGAALCLRVGARFVLAADSAVLASLPWLGVKTLYYPAAYPHVLHLPQLHFTRSAYFLLMPLYYLAEYPLLEAAKACKLFARVICSFGKGEMEVEAFAVFVFWAGVALAFALSGLTGILIGDTRKDAPSSQWFPRPGLARLLCWTGVLAIAIVPFAVAVEADIADLTPSS